MNCQERKDSLQNSRAIWTYITACETSPLLNSVHTYSLLISFLAIYHCTIITISNNFMIYGLHSLQNDREIVLRVCQKRLINQKLKNK